MRKVLPGVIRLCILLLGVAHCITGKNIAVKCSHSFVRNISVFIIRQQVEGENMARPLWFTKKFREIPVKYVIRPSPKGRPLQECPS